MSDVDQAVPITRAAVRRLLAAARKADHAAPTGLRDGRLAVAVSGGADSLALAAAAAYVGPREDLTVHGLIVDHGLQSGSDDIAARTADVLRGLGLTAEVLTVRVDGPGGLEAAARRARYAALRTADTLVLLGHTRDDQAETVLLGLGRGSGPRSIAGMRPLDPPWGRPFLGLSRAITVAACARLGLEPWADPHNVNPRFTRVRLRSEVLPLLEDVLAGGVADALGRTAAQLQEDLDALDDWANRVIETYLTPGSTAISVEPLVDLPVAVRRRVLRGWLLAGGVRELTDPQLRAADELVGNWRGQGEVWLPGGLVVRRARGRLQLDRTDRSGDRVPNPPGQ
ncbi:MAG TPA: tRNA lysidine(34) synthetase TilS [Pseudonocardiaceae bacterium]|jgi:tRNA(Ile)-lysidine synthase|nr:tRNA lysidine(34) synthetase TilS [Pseudonocardiaceae bacterium]